MIKKMYTVHDSKSELYNTPIFTRSRGEALRIFQDVTNNGQETNPISQHPADFHLFELGEYDDCTGQIKMYETKENLGCALDFVDRKSDSVRQIPLPLEERAH